MNQPSEIQTSSPIQEQEISLLNLLLLLARYKRAFIAVPIIAGTVAFGVVSMQAKEYTAILRIAPSKNASIFNWLLNNNQLIDQVSNELQLARHYKTETRKATQRALINNVKLTLNAKDGFLDVAATDASPQFAAKMANAYGRALSRNLFEMRLMDVSKGRYGLELRRAVATKNRAQADRALTQPQIKAAIERISPSEQYGLISMAGIQAEAALQGGVSDLAQSQIVKMQEQLASLQRLVVDSMKPQNGAAGAWIAAVSGLQERAYWNAMIERLDRRIELARAQENDELRIVWADVPDEKSGPKRGVAVVLAMLTGIMVSLLYAVVHMGVRASRENKSEPWQKLTAAWSNKE